MSFDEVLINYKNMSVADKRMKIIDNVKYMIAFLEKICDEKKINYRKISSREVLDLKNGYESEDDYLEGLFVYINVLKEMLGSYLNNTI